MPGKSETVCIGLDPGMQGGMAVLAGSSVLFTARWPVVKIAKSGGGEKTEYLEADILALLETWSNVPDAHLFLEKQQAMPGQGVTSMFSTGQGYGMLRMALTALKKPWTLVRAQAWQKVMFEGMSKPAPKIAKGGKNAGKEVSQKASEVLGPLLCARLWPTVDLRATPASRTPHSGICDALLMAEYGRRLLQGGAC